MTQLSINTGAKPVESEVPLGKTEEVPEVPEVPDKAKDTGEESRLGQIFGQFDRLPAMFSRERSQEEFRRRVLEPLRRFVAQRNALAAEEGPTSAFKRVTEAYGWVSAMFFCVATIVLICDSAFRYTFYRNAGIIAVIMVINVAFVYGKLVHMLRRNNARSIGICEFVLATSPLAFVALFLLSLMNYVYMYAPSLFEVAAVITITFLVRHLDFDKKFLHPLVRVALLSVGVRLFGLLVLQNYGNQASPDRIFGPLAPSLFIALYVECALNTIVKKKITVDIELPTTDPKVETQSEEDELPSAAEMVYRMVLSSLFFPYHFLAYFGLVLE